jgi:hypothetical protein
MEQWMDIKEGTKEEMKGENREEGEGRKRKG